MESVRNSAGHSHNMCTDAFPYSPNLDLISDFSFHLQRQCSQPFAQRLNVSDRLGVFISTKIGALPPANNDESLITLGNETILQIMHPFRFGIAPEAMCQHDQSGKLKILGFLHF